MVRRSTSRRAVALTYFRISWKRLFIRIPRFYCVGYRTKYYLGMVIGYLDHGRQGMTSTVVIISPGNMGSGVGRRLTENNVKVLTSLAGRSEESAKRARAAPQHRFWYCWSPVLAAGQ